MVWGHVFWYTNNRWRFFKYPDYTPATFVILLVHNLVTKLDARWKEAMFIPSVNIHFVHLSLIKSIRVIHNSP